MSVCRVEDASPKLACQQGRDGVADLSRAVFAVSLENEGIRKSLNTRSFANRKAPILNRMCETAASKAVKSSRERHRGFVPRQTAVHVLVAMGRIVDMARKLQFVGKMVSAPALRYRANALEINRREARFSIVVWDARMAAAVCWRARKVGNRVPDSAGHLLCRLGDFEM